MGRVMQTLLERMMNGDGQVNWSTLGQALDRTLHSRDLLITFADPVLNAPLHAAHLDGALLPSEGDYVMVVDTSMGFNKVSSVTAAGDPLFGHALHRQRAASAADLGVYQHQSTAGRVCASTARLQFGHHLSAVDSTMLLALSAGAGPAGRELIAASRHPTGPGELNTGQLSDGATRVSEEDGKTVFGTFLIVPRGQQVESSLSYTLPVSIVQADNAGWVYHLVWQKQPGATAWPVTVTVQWPDNKQLSSAQPQPVETTDHSATFQFNLDADHEVRVSLKNR